MTEADDDPLDDLAARSLLPPNGCSVVPPSAPPDVDLRAAFRGALVGTAVGDALGRPAEGLGPHAVAQRYGRLTDYRPWRLHDGTGPVGTFTDDTQMTICVAEALLAGDGQLDPDDLARRFIDWLPTGRGRGRTCVEAIQRLQGGHPWHRAGVRSAGNGAAMRVAPIGLVHHSDLDALRRTAAVSAVITHADPMAVVSAVAQAWLVAACAATRPGDLDPRQLLAGLDAVLADLADDGAVPRNSADGQPLRLQDRLAEVGERLDQPVEQVTDHFYNGAFVLESLPTALWCFLRSPEDPEEVLVTAVNAGYDADTVAAMAGALAGAYLGDGAFPARWTGDDLEHADQLRQLADDLFDVSRSCPGPAPASAPPSAAAATHQAERLP